MIKLERITKDFYAGSKRIQVLKGISFTIQPGEMLSIMGASGSGKSTLMNILGLLDKPSSGKYFLNDKEVSELSDNERADIRNQRIGFVFQQFHLLPKLSVLENISLPMHYAGSDKKNIKPRVEEVLSQVNMAEYLHHKPMMLSGGQQQRVAIARALVLKPTIILADEPTGALDSETSKDVMGLFHALHQNLQATIVIITHDKQVSSECEREIFIKDGLIEGSHD